MRRWLSPCVKITLNRNTKSKIGKTRPQNVQTENFYGKTNVGSRTRKANTETDATNTIETVNSTDVTYAEYLTLANHFTNRESSKTNLRPWTKKDNRACLLIKAKNRNYRPLDQV